LQAAKFTRGLISEDGGPASEVRTHEKMERGSKQGYREVVSAGQEKNVPKQDLWGRKGKVKEPGQPKRQAARQESKQATRITSEKGT